MYEQQFMKLGLMVQ